MRSDISWGDGQSKEPCGSLQSEKPVFFCNMNNRGVGLHFHRLKGSGGDTAVLSGVCVCVWGGGTYTDTLTPTCMLGTGSGQRSPDEPCAHPHHPSGHRWRCLGKGGECIYAVENSAFWLSSRGGAGIHTPACQGSQSPKLSPSFCFHIQYKQGTLRSRMVSSYLCRTPSDLNLWPMGLDSGTELRAGAFCRPHSFLEGKRSL